MPPGVVTVRVGGVTARASDICDPEYSKKGILLYSYIEKSIMAIEGLGILLEGLGILLYSFRRARNPILNLIFQLDRSDAKFCKFPEEFMSLAS